MNMRFMYRLLLGCYCISLVILLILLFSKLCGGFPEEWKILFRVICLVTAVGLAFSMVCCYLGGAFGRIGGAVSMPEKSRLEILKEHAEYDRSHKEKPYTYEFRMGSKVPEILKKYEYDKYLEGVEPGQMKWLFGCWILYVTILNIFLVQSLVMGNLQPG